MLVRPHFPSPAAASQYLVEDQQCAVAIAEVAHSHEKLVRKRDDTTRPLDGLNQDCSNLVIGVFAKNVFYEVGAVNFALRSHQAEWTPVAVCVGTTEHAGWKWPKPEPARSSH